VVVAAAARGVEWRGRVCLLKLIVFVQRQVGFVVLLLQKKQKKNKNEKRKNCRFFNIKTQVLTCNFLYFCRVCLSAAAPGAAVPKKLVMSDVMTTHHNNIPQNSIITRKHGSTISPMFISLPLWAHLIVALLLTVTCQVSDEEITALFNLHSSTNGKEWRWKNELIEGPKWNFTKHANSSEYIHNPCSSKWQGVTCSKLPQFCSSQTCSITELVLVEYDLSGHIPGEVSDLVGLEILSLKNNLLTGWIPSEIGSLSALRVMELHYNQISGPVPSDLGNLLALETFNMDKNLLSGTLPKELCNLTLLCLCMETKFLVLFQLT
jgi:hypothetical protein